MNEAESLRSEAVRLLRSVDGMPLAEAMDVRRRAMRLIGLAARTGRHSPITIE